MVVTLDTNVLFSALYSKKGASFQILDLILKGKIELALSVPIYFEYKEVLNRKANLKKLGLSKLEITNILDLIILLAKKHKIYFLLRPNLLDEADNIFIECVFASGSEYLITSNTKHFQNPQLRLLNTKISTPKEFMQDWNKK